MIRYIKIIILFGFFFHSMWISGQIDTVEIKEIAVSGQRSPSIYSELNRVVTVIRKEQIRNAPVQSLQEILEYAVNVDVRQRGDFGVQADISIRGGSFEQTLILLNGIKINDPQTGHHNLNIPIDINSIERIEILQGPGSRVFGPNAFSGAINIITKPKESNNVNLVLTGGEHGYYKTNLSGSLRLGKADNFISIGRSGSNGYIENTDFGISNFFYHGSVTFAHANLDVQAGYQDKAFGANSFYTPKYPNQYEHTKTTLASIKLTTGNKIKISPLIYWRRHQDRFELFRDNPAVWYTGHNYHLTDIYGAEVNFIFNTNLGKTAVGLDFRSENILSNVLGESTGDTLDVPGEPAGFFTRRKSRENISLFLEQNIIVKKFSASAGILTNWNTDFDWNIYTGIDMSYKITRDAKIYASINQSLRIPTFTDLYYVGPTNVGNPHLKPEEAITYELGTKYQKQFFHGHLSFFRRNGKNMIDWVRLPDSLKWESKNITQIITRGFEIAGSLGVNRLFNKSFPIKYIKLSYSFLETEKQSGEYISVYILDYLKHKLNLEIEHSLYKNLGASWKITFQDRAGTYTDFTTGQEKSYEPFLLINSRLFWNKETYTIFVEASNLLNTQYFDLSNVGMPGRWIRFGGSVNLNLGK
ncbi:MAG: TonB-dependent receptor [Bacteroidetes bacterium]|nr:TonB-dependent receptor [Bacteroidota bacterium]